MKDEDRWRIILSYGLIATELLRCVERLSGVPWGIDQPLCAPRATLRKYFDRHAIIT